jgi:endogenous inhibitor of DNA gyrase (YacG/DUF329 family)
MANQPLLAFKRRHNADGTWDSICLRCYRTVANAQDPAWLPLLQGNHTCALVDLHLWLEDRYEYGSMACQESPIADFELKTCRIISF